eukprot:642728-Rhodomonas_salina.1
MAAVRRMSTAMQEDGEVWMEKIERMRWDCTANAHARNLLPGGNITQTQLLAFRFGRTGSAACSRTTT